MNENETDPQDANGTRDRLARLWQAAARLGRVALFGSVDADRWMPTSHLDDARTPFCGYLGTGFRPGLDPLLLAINPGGGGTAAERPDRVMANQTVYLALRAFLAAPPAARRQAFERANRAVADVMLTWPIGILVNETLAATRRGTLNHFAFMNLVPYRTLDNLTPPRKAWKVGWRELVEPSLKDLDPVAIFALGAPPRDALQKWGAAQTSPVFYLKRLRGDVGVSPAARAVLDLVQSVEWGDPPTTRPRLVRPK